MNQLVEHRFIILSNTVFLVAHKAELQATIVHIDKTAPTKNKLSTFSAPKKQITTVQEAQYRPKTAMPFDQAPIPNKQLFINSVMVLVNSSKSDVHKSTQSLGLVISDFVHLQEQKNTSPFSKPVLVLFSTHGKSYCATRPPPVC